MLKDKRKLFIGNLNNCRFCVTFKFFSTSYTKTFGSVNQSIGRGEGGFKLNGLGMRLCPVQHVDLELTRNDVW